MTEVEKLQATLQKCKAMANDKSTTPHERESARAKMSDIQIKLSKLRSDDPQYKAWVQQGKAAVKAGDDASWTLAELAFKVKSKHGEGKLEQYADDIGYAYTTLVRYRTAYKAFENAPRGAISVGAAKALAGIKDEKLRHAIVKENPNITARQAEDKTRQIKTEIKAAKAKTKKAKGNGIDQEETSKKKSAAYTIKGGVSTLVTIFESMLDTSGNVAERMEKIQTLNDEERNTLLTALWNLNSRVAAAIKLVKQAPASKE